MAAFVPKSTHSPHIRNARKTLLCPLRPCGTENVPFIRCLPVTMAQWLMRSAPEHEDAGLIPGRGGRFSDGGEKQTRPCVGGFGAC